MARKMVIPTGKRNGFIKNSGAECSGHSRCCKQPHEHRLACSRFQGHAASHTDTGALARVSVCPEMSLKKRMGAGRARFQFRLSLSNGYPPPRETPYPSDSSPFSGYRRQTLSRFPPEHTIVRHLTGPKIPSQRRQRGPPVILGISLPAPPFDESLACVNFLFWP